MDKQHALMFYLIFAAALALRGAAFTRGRPRIAPAAAVALRHPSPLATAAAAGLPYTALVSSPSQAALKYAPTLIHNIWLEYYEYIVQR